MTTVVLVALFAACPASSTAGDLEGLLFVGGFKGDLNPAGEMPQAIPLQETFAVWLVEILGARNPDFSAEVLPVELMCDSAPLANADRMVTEHGAGCFVWGSYSTLDGRLEITVWISCGQTGLPNRQSTVVASLWRENGIRPSDINPSLHAPRWFAAVAHVVAAQWLASDSEYLQAIGQMNEAMEYLDALPGFEQSDLLLCRSVLLQEVGDWTSAMEDASEAVRLEPRSVQAMERLAALELSKGLDSQVAELFASALNDSVMRDTTVSIIGSELLLLDPGRRNAILLAIARLCPDDAGVRRETAACLVNYGNDLFAAGAIDSAVAMQSCAIELDSMQAQAYYNRALCRYVQGSYRLAIEDADCCLAIDPTEADAWTLRAEACRNIGETSEALASIDMALEIDPSNCFYLTRRIAFNWDANDIESVRRDAERIIELQPSNPIGYSRMAEYEEEIGDHAAAIGSISRAIELGSDTVSQAQDIFMRGKMRHIHGEVEEAIEDYTEALRLDPQLYEACFFRGLLRADAGDLAGASGDMNTVVTGSPDPGLRADARNALLQIQSTGSGNP
jgi:tetratricopeptide (TPR) repeat protein